MAINESIRLKEIYRSQQELRACGVRRIAPDLERLRLEAGTAADRVAAVGDRTVEELGGRSRVRRDLLALEGRSGDRRTWGDAALPGPHPQGCGRVDSVGGLPPEALLEELEDR